MTEIVFERLGVSPVDPEPQSKVGIALETLAQRPINGLRHPLESDSNGWYIWCGEYSEAPDFFKPLHVEHLEEHLPQVQKFLSLPPGYRFLIDDEGNEDVWFDDSLLGI
jgi:hypothetical protein